MVFYAPTVNSYKRFRAGSWAPTRLAWSHDNRTASFRVVGKGPSLRIECRIPGADCNPYLCFAAALASGLDGIANKIEPPPLFDRRCLRRASPCRPSPRPCAKPRKSFESSPFVREALGDEVAATLRPFLRDRAVRLRYRGHRLGAQALLLKYSKPVGQAIAFCGLLGWAFRPRNLMKNWHHGKGGSGRSV